jgi:hypothetical protein
MTQGFDGSVGWAKAVGQIQDDPAGARKMKEEYERSLFHVFGHPEELQVQALPEPRTIEGASYSAAFVKSETVRDWMMFFDAEGRLARMEYAGEGPAGPARATKVMSDWRPVGALQYPHSNRLLLDNQPLMESVVTAAKLNPELAADLFKRPAE